MSLQLLISDLIVCSVSGLVLLQLLLPLPELPFRVADVASEAVGVEVVVTARLGKPLTLLKTPGMNRSMNYKLKVQILRNICANASNTKPSQYYKKSQLIIIFIINKSAI